MVIIMNPSFILCFIIIVGTLIIISKQKGTCDGTLIIIYATIYNKIMIYKTKIEKAEGIIDESLRAKYDAICRINTYVKKIVTKKDYLKEYIDLKNKKISNYDLDRKLTEAVNTIMELKNDYSDLDSKEINKELKNINQINEDLTSSKNYFNKNTNELNSLIRKFPMNIVAKIHHYKIKPFFDGKNMQDEIIDDFKL